MKKNWKLREEEKRKIRRKEGGKRGSCGENKVYNKRLSQSENRTKQILYYSVRFINQGMDFFDGPYFQINKFFLYVIGQWPYLSLARKRCTQFLVTVALFSCLLPSVNFPLFFYEKEKFYTSSFFLFFLN